MKRKRRTRLLSLFLGLSLALSPAARALTPEQAGDLLNVYYIDDVPEEVLEQSTISGMLEVLGDPYTQYFTPEEYALFSSSLSDTELVGIGISSLITGEGLLIQRVYENTPAASGGLQAGDLITAVDGTDIAGQDGDTMTGLLQGEPGTQVAVTYLRDGESTTVSLTRAAITIPTAYTELWDGHIGYIDCDTFGGETVEHFTDGLETYGDQADRWIVDLRGNGGGVVDAAIGAVSTFSGSGLLAYLKDSDGSYGAFGSNDEALTTAPVIVLADENTASASELFASDVRDTGVGIVIGSRSFGKGVAQIVLDENSLPGYFDDGDAMKITTYRFYAPGGGTTDTVGVIPHLLVDPDLADEVAVLLCSPAPEGSTEGYLRLDFNRVWYISLEQASSPEYQAAFTALLEALPVGVTLQSGTGSSWAAVEPAAVAEACGLTGYQSRGFSDTADSPYASLIDRLAAYGIVSGSGDGTYNPEGSLTRAELCALLAKALNCRVPTGESRFTDVSMDDWYGMCANAVAALGLVEGVGGGRFNPNGTVTQQELITIAARLGQRLGMRLELAARDIPDGAADGDAYQSYASWARESVWLLAESQTGLLGNTISLLWAPLEDIDPGAPATRAEAAALTCSLLTYLGILPS